MNKQGVIFMVVQKYHKQHNVSNTRQKAPFWVYSLSVSVTLNINFYRAMLRRARYCYGKSSVCPSVCPSVCLSVTLRYCDYIGWNSSKIISPSVSLGCSLFATPTWRVYSKGTPRNFCPNRGGVLKKWV